MTLIVNCPIAEAPAMPKEFDAPPMSLIRKEIRLKTKGSSGRVVVFEVLQQ
jgi:hypothetical protein